MPIVPPTLSSHSDTSVLTHEGGKRRDTHSGDPLPAAVSPDRDGGKRLLDSRRQHGHTVFVAFSGSHANLVADEVDIFVSSEIESFQFGPLFWRRGPSDDQAYV